MVRIDGNHTSKQARAEEIDRLRRAYRNNHSVRRYYGVAAMIALKHRARDPEAVEAAALKKITPEIFSEHRRYIRDHERFQQQQQAGRSNLDLGRVSEFAAWKDEQCEQRQQLMNSWRR